MNDYPSKAEFEAAVDSEFIMQLDDGLAVPVRLKKCDTKTDTPLQESFSLIFVAPADFPPVQSLRRARHAVLGEMSIFLVPVKQDETGLYLEAVFNRLRV
jgi:hypothetical protein